jgi:hypothetical protein
MKQFILKYLDPNNDVDFLNETQIQFDFEDGDKDSGWCDMFTGARILTSNDVIIFQSDEQDESMLKFRLGGRLVELKSN